MGVPILRGPLIALLKSMMGPDAPESPFAIASDAPLAASRLLKEPVSTDQRRNSEQ